MCDVVASWSNRDRDTKGGFLESKGRRERGRERGGGLAKEAELSLVLTDNTLKTQGPTDVVVLVSYFYHFLLGLWEFDEFSTMGY